MRDEFEEFGSECFKLAELHSDQLEETLPVMPESQKSRLAQPFLEQPPARADKYGRVGHEGPSLTASLPVTLARDTTPQAASPGSQQEALKHRHVSDDQRPLAALPISRPAEGTMQTLENPGWEADAPHLTTRPMVLHSPVTKASNDYFRQAEYPGELQREAEGRLAGQVCLLLVKGTIPTLTVYISTCWGQVAL